MPLFGVVVRPGEVLLIMLFTFLFFKALWRPVVGLEALKPVSAPLTLLGVMYLFSIIYSVVIKKDAYGLAETRNIVGWLALPIATFLLAHLYRRVESYLLAFSALVAILLVTQTVFGVQLIFSERGAEALSSEFQDVVRSSAGASIFLLGYSMYFSLGRAASTRNPVGWLLLFMLLGAGILATFTRGAWLAAAIGFLVFLSLTRIHRHAPWMLLVTALTGLVAFTVMAAVKPRLAEVVVARVESIATEGQRGSSVGARLDENEQAIKAIQRNPFLGVGIGGAYKEYTSTRGTAVQEGEFTYIHNSYLGLAVKVGLVASVIPFWISFILWRRARVHRPKKIEELRGFKLSNAAGQAAIVMFMINALTQPEWLRLGGITVVSILLAITLVATEMMSRGAVEMRKQ